MTDEAKTTIYSGPMTLERILKVRESFENELNEVVPKPNPELVLPESPVELSKILQTFGGYAAYLNVLVGRLKAEYDALNDALKTMLQVMTASVNGKSEAEKVSKALASSLEAREAKKRLIELEVKIEIATSYLKAYERLWETTSRTLTALQVESGLVTGRTP